MGDFLQGVLGDLRVRELESFQRDSATQHHLAVRYATNRNLIGGSMFSCVDRLLCFVVMAQLITVINFAFATQFVTFDYVDVRDREEASTAIDAKH